MSSRDADTSFDLQCRLQNRLTKCSKCLQWTQTSQRTISSTSAIPATAMTFYVVTILTERNSISVRLWALLRCVKQLLIIANNYRTDPFLYGYFRHNASLLSPICLEVCRQNVRTLERKEGMYPHILALTPHMKSWVKVCSSLQSIITADWAHFTQKKNTRIQNVYSPTKGVSGISLHKVMWHSVHQVRSRF